MFLPKIVRLDADRCRTPWLRFANSGEAPELVLVTGVESLQLHLGPAPCISKSQNV